MAGARDRRRVPGLGLAAAWTTPGARATLRGVAYDEDVAERLRDLLEGQKGVSEKRMFGGLAFLVNGYMAVTASGHGGLLLRCDPGRSGELCALPKVERAVMRGRAMDGWLRVGAEAILTDEQLEEWVAIGVTYARSLPPRP